MPDNTMDTIRINPFHITDINELKISGENVTSIAEPLDNIIYVSKNGSDLTGNGSLGNPFLTISYANNYAIENIPVWPIRVIIKVAPGLYAGEHLTQAHYRVHIVGTSLSLDQRERDVIIANLGTSPDTYPLGMNKALNLNNVTVATMDAIYDNYVSGVFGTLMNTTQFSNCTFKGGYFVEQEEADAENLYMNFGGCFFTGDAFKLAAVTRNFNRFIALRNCDISQGTTTFECTGTGIHTVKLENTMLGNPLTIGGDVALVMQWSELYSNGYITFNTTNFVDIFSSIIINGINFVTDPVETKKLVNCLFRDIPADTGDVTGDVNVEFIEYTGNHQCNGVDGEVMTTNKMKTVAGGQNYYRNIHEALKSCNQDSIIDMWGDITVGSTLTVPTGYKVTINGSKLWSITATCDNLVEIGNDQELAFVNVRKITGGKKAILNGNSSGLRFINCGQTLADPCYVNIEVNGGDIGSTLFIEKTLILGTGAPVIKVNDVDPWIIIGKSFLNGASTKPAIEWTVDADSRFRCKYSTLIHGSNGSNSPLLNSVGSGQIIISMYNSALNANFPTADFTNNILQCNTTVDPEIDY